MAKVVFDIDQVKKDLIKTLKLTGIDGKEDMQSHVKVATGNLQRNIDWNVTEEGNNVILTFSMPFYAKYVEYGLPPMGGEGVNTTRAYMSRKFVEAIKEWCKIKGIPEEAAYPIAKSISEHGTRPQPFIRPYINNRLMRDLKNNLKISFK